MLELLEAMEVEHKEVAKSGSYRIEENIEMKMNVRIIKILREHPYGLLVVGMLSIVVIFSCQKDKNPIKNNPAIRIPGVFFANYKYLQKTNFLIGFDVFIGVNEKIVKELPDSASVTLVSGLGDSEVVVLYYLRNFDIPLSHKAYGNSISSVGTAIADVGNGILEVNPEGDAITVFYTPFAGGGQISDSAMIVGSITFNNREYKYQNGKWYVRDHVNKDKWWELIINIITVKFKSNVPQITIDSLNSEIGTTIVRKNILGYYDLKLPEGRDPIEAIKDYLESGLVESAETNVRGEYHFQT